MPRALDKQRSGKRRELAFTVDATLLRELGERLVGKPHIALAELIKNAYDADATEVRVAFSKNRLVISDNGNGMSFDEFEGFWMRVGSPHKQLERTSPRFRRSMTGSKGVGRLAAQFLANKLEIRTKSRSQSSDEIQASVNWSEAIKAGDLTRATARYALSRTSGDYPAGNGHGTVISLTDLQHDWTNEELVELAREIWWLQPPFNPNPTLREDARSVFNVVLEHTAKSAAREFDQQMRAIVENWYARIRGSITRLESGAARVGVQLEFDNADSSQSEFEIGNSALSGGDFEIRIFALSNRQAKGIKVETAREYFKRFGGVHVYDAGFHLPYYGPDTDWLRIEMDHSHRLSRSALLPAALQVPNGMNNLPTQSRILGAVHVDTAAEQAAGSRAHRRDYLKIQVSRDRLVDNTALDQLRDAVRWALDYYAMQETLRRTRGAERQQPTEAPGKKLSRVKRVLVENRGRIPKPLFERLEAGLSDAAEASSGESESNTRSMGLLGALATAGMVAIAYESEIAGQFRRLESTVSQLRAIQAAERIDRAKLEALTNELQAWYRRARGTRELFSHLESQETRTNASRFKARSFIEDARDQIEPLLGGASIDVGLVSAAERLPLGTYAEWIALFQNVMLNAAAAVQESEKKQVVIISGEDGREHRITVEDTGRGVDLREAPKLFEPFVRGLDRRAEGNGRHPDGAGLGLTIVRMIATKLSCRVKFVRPDPGFNTALEISWTES